MRHSHLDTLLLAGVGTLAVHELAYLPTGVGAAVGGDGIAHADAPIGWAIGGVLAAFVMARAVVSALRTRVGGRRVNPIELAATLAAIFVSMESLERALAADAAISLLGDPALWLGLMVVPVVAWALASVVNQVVAVGAGRHRGAWVVVPARCGGYPIEWAPARLALASCLSRRGPPSSRSF